MKRTKRTIGTLLIVLIGFLQLSCNSFLEINDPSYTNLDFYNTKVGQKKLLIDINTRYRNVFNTYFLQFLGTDMYIACDESPRSTAFNGYDKSLSGLSGTDDYWKVLYKIVEESNILLNRCTPEIAGNEYEAMRAKARFFRAMAYYYLVETFGPVPLLTEEMTNVDNIITSVTREPEVKIYSFIIDELNGSLGKLPETTTEAGELTNTAVKFFQAKMYLTRSYRNYAENKDSETAIDLFESIIVSGKYKLLPRFADVFTEDNQNNQEVIWSIQYGTDKNFNGDGNPQQSLLGFNITALYPGLFALNQKDYPSMQRDYWTNPIVHEWFRHPDIDSRYGVTFKREFYINDMSNADYGKLGIYMPLWNDNSNDSKGAKYYYPFKNSEGKYNWYPAFGTMSWVTDCMPMCQKFKESKIAWGEKGTREDIVFRMADVYLLCAEAYLKINQKDKAVEKVNDILRRAAVSETAFETMKLENANELTVDRLLEERACEMFGEHDRWFDLKRTNTLLTRAKLNPLVVHYANLSAIHLVRPIPYNERIKLKGLDQNQGYDN